MNPWRVVTEALIAFFIVIIAGFFGVSREFADRTPPRASIGTFSVGGILLRDVPGAIDAYERKFDMVRMTIHLRGKHITHTLAELGMTLDTEHAIQHVRAKNVRVLPRILFANEEAQSVLEQDFADVLKLPKNPTLNIRPDYSVAVAPGVAGEAIDMISLNNDIAHTIEHGRQDRILARVIRAVPNEDPSRMEVLRSYAEHILTTGFLLTYGQQQLVMQKQDIASLLRFQESSGTGIAVDEELVHQYLVREIAPKINRDAVNARFEIQDGRVTQFALPQHGEELDIPGSIQAIQAALASRAFSVVLAVDKKQPVIPDTESTVAFGVTSLLARGETDFKSSPKNRIHNIRVGASRYHGLLIAPGQEFSFNEFLGPVNALSGFKPELVIKNNVTTPEFGGGLCQVSTTMFRAAVYAGAKITMRRNHSYAVRYYGTPGFDATIYPPYTDFRFLNNTPGYLLIQTKIDGTRLLFELWGTADGREVIVDGPHPYNKLSSGAVKATLTQKVIRDGATLIEDTFRSNYKSPALFPRL